MPVMGPEERRQRPSNYWVCYYDELRGQLANYAADPEDAPPHFRGHGRRIQTWECLDGYVILHCPDPENVHDAETPERFELVTNTRDVTVNRVMREEMPEGSLPSDAPFWVTHALYFREDGTGEWVTGNEWERRDLISNRRIER